MQPISFKTIAFVLFASLSMVSTARAEPSSPPVLVNQVRVFENGATPFALVETAAPTVCGVATFTIDLTSAAGPAMLSIAISAFTAREHVVLEVSNSTGCAGYGTRLQSITLTTRSA
ncbi:hypothetical protein [Caulobacter sp. LARHSG274]